MNVCIIRGGGVPPSRYRPATSLTVGADPRSASAQLCRPRDRPGAAIPALHVSGFSRWSPPAAVRHPAIPSFFEIIRQISAPGDSGAQKSGSATTKAATGENAYPTGGQARMPVPPQQRQSRNFGKLVLLRLTPASRIVSFERGVNLIPFRSWLSTACQATGERRVAGTTLQGQRQRVAGPQGLRRSPDPEGSGSGARSYLLGPAGLGSLGQIRRILSTRGYS